ncbi:MAG: outer membrane lipoprotein carrier protein LolA [Pasteurellaceae bacterium]|nr:outer membrane lipoprotein carrier protein LolA [Pasteurellaceae bacterium]
MKKYLFSLFLAFSSPLVFAFSAQDLVAILQQPQTIHGDFTQQRFLKALPKPITTTGNFTLLKNKGLLWQMQKPFASDVRVTAQGIMQWNGQAWVENRKMGQSQQIQLFLGVLSGNIEGLSSQFNLQLTGTADNWQLRLTPSSLLMKQIFSHIQLHGDTLVKRIELHETQGDRTVIELQNNQVNQPLAAFAQSALQAN